MVSSKVYVTVVMIQLYVSEETIGTLLEHARKDLGEYSNILETLYYDPVSDHSITSLLTIKTMVRRWSFSSNKTVLQLSQLIHSLITGNCLCIMPILTLVTFIAFIASVAEGLFGPPHQRLSGKGELFTPSV